ncbi:LOW QUALITY PROTEIN: YLP motif-containing protein 1 [Callorhinchus milii]|uniref:LOW QUALITY PROTEIN: YLP motif-containing protein 1 n=1 Tax=Callorhinchus milii TaxID=7868 RepID=UPI001C3FACAD|nr:LOW QUALITY PROTEIN: YLP motif-containing protein 1 [Callorhinchus milii]
MYPSWGRYGGGGAHYPYYGGGGVGAHPPLPPGPRVPAPAVAAVAATPSPAVAPPPTPGAGLAASNFQTLRQQHLQQMQQLQQMHQQQMQSVLQHPAHQPPPPLPPPPPPAALQLQPPPPQGSWESSGPPQPGQATHNNTQQHPDFPLPLQPATGNTMTSPGDKKVPNDLSKTINGSYQQQQQFWYQQHLQILQKHGSKQFGAHQEISQSLETNQISDSLLHKQGEAKALYTSQPPLPPAAAHEGPRTEPPPPPPKDDLPPPPPPEESKPSIQPPENPEEAERLKQLQAAAAQWQQHRIEYQHQNMMQHHNQLQQLLQQYQQLMQQIQHTQSMPLDMQLRHLEIQQQQFIPLYQEWQRQFQIWKVQLQTYPNKNQLQQHETQWSQWQEQMASTSHHLQERMDALRNVQQQYINSQSQSYTSRGPPPSGPPIPPLPTMAATYTSNHWFFCPPIKLVSHPYFFSSDFCSEESIIIPGSIIAFISGHFSIIKSPSIIPGPSHFIPGPSPSSQRPPPSSQDPHPSTQDPPPSTQDQPPSSQDPPLSTQVPPLSTQIPPLSTQIPPPTVQFPPPTAHFPPPASHFPPPASHFPPPSSHFPPPPSHFPPPSSHFPPPSSHFPPPDSLFPPPSSHFPPPSSHFPPPSAHFPPPSSQFPPHVAQVPPPASKPLLPVPQATPLVSKAPPLTAKAPPPASKAPPLAPSSAALSPSVSLTSQAAPAPSQAASTAPQVPPLAAQAPPLTPALATDQKRPLMPSPHPEVNLASGSTTSDGHFEPHGLRPSGQSQGGPRFEGPRGPRKDGPGGRGTYRFNGPGARERPHSRFDSRGPRHEGQYFEEMPARFEEQSASQRFEEQAPEKHFDEKTGSPHFEGQTPGPRFEGHGPGSHYEGKESDQEFEGQEPDHHFEGRDPDHCFPGRGRGFQGRGQRFQGRGQRFRGRGQRFQGRGQRFQGRGQHFDGHGRGQRVEDHNRGPHFEEHGESPGFEGHSPGHGFEERGRGQRFEQGWHQGFEEQDQGQHFEGRGRGHRFEEHGWGQRFDEHSRGHHFDDHGRGQRFEAHGRGQCFEDHGRGHRFDNHGRGRRFEEHGRGQNFEEQDRGQRFEGQHSEDPGIDERFEEQCPGERFEEPDRGQQCEGRGRGQRFEGPGSRFPGTSSRFEGPRTRFDGPKGHRFSGPRGHSPHVEGPQASAAQRGQGVRGLQPASGQPEQDIKPVEEKKLETATGDKNSEPSEDKVPQTSVEQKVKEKAVQGNVEKSSDSSSVNKDLLKKSTDPSKSQVVHQKVDSSEVAQPSTTVVQEQTVEPAVQSSSKIQSSTASPATTVTTKVISDKSEPKTVTTSKRFESKPGRSVNDREKSQDHRQHGGRDHPPGHKGDVDSNVDAMGKRPPLHHRGNCKDIGGRKKADRQMIVLGDPERVHHMTERGLYPGKEGIGETPAPSFGKKGTHLGGKNGCMVDAHLCPMSLDRREMRPSLAGDDFDQGFDHECDRIGRPYEHGFGRDRDHDREYFHRHREEWDMRDHGREFPPLCPPPDRWREEGWRDDNERGYHHEREREPWGRDTTEKSDWRRDERDYPPDRGGWQRERIDERRFPDTEDRRFDDLRELPPPSVPVQSSGLPEEPPRSFSDKPGVDQHSGGQNIVALSEREHEIILKAAQELKLLRELQEIERVPLLPGETDTGGHPRRIQDYQNTTAGKDFYQDMPSTEKLGPVQSQPAIKSERWDTDTFHGLWDSGTEPKVPEPKYGYNEPSPVSTPTLNKPPPIQQTVDYGHGRDVGRIEQIPYGERVPLGPEPLRDRLYDKDPLGPRDRYGDRDPFLERRGDPYLDRRDYDRERDVFRERSIGDYDREGFERERFGREERMSHLPSGRSGGYHNYQDSKDPFNRGGFDRPLFDRLPDRSPFDHPSSGFGGERRGFSDERIPPSAPPPSHPPPRVERKPESKNVDDILKMPGRQSRPDRIVVIMRGLPGSGKTHVAKLIRDKEVEYGGAAPRVLSLDDYFMTEVEKVVKDPDSGKRVKKKLLEYEYEPEMEETYRSSMFKTFRKTLDDGFFPFIIIDAINNRVKHFEQFWSAAKTKGFEVYIAEMSADNQTCAKRNIHGRKLKEINKMSDHWDSTPRHMLRLDIRSLLQDAAIEEVEMEDFDPNSEQQQQQQQQEEESKKEAPDEEEYETGFITKSKWEMDTSEENLDKLDGLRSGNKRKRGWHDSMAHRLEDYLQLPDDYNSRSSEPGKKRVRWADLEEEKDAERKRAIGFVVGQTDWEKITDEKGELAQRALNRTKYF